jgi:GTP-binding protein LepA
LAAPCCGGKLLDRQNEGKKRMRQFGKLEIPQSAFLAALKIDS